MNHMLLYRVEILENGLVPECSIIYNIHECTCMVSTSSDLLMVGQGQYSVCYIDFVVGLL